MAKVVKKINDDKWTIKVADDGDLMAERDDGAGLAGLCIPEKKLILIHEDSVNFQTICHEIFHAYWTDLHLDDTNNIPLADIEEIAANQFAAKAETMIKKTKEILKALKKGQ